MCVRGVTLKPALSSWDPVFELRSDIAADGRTRKRWLPESDCTADDCSNRRHLIAGVVQTLCRWHIGSFDHTHANFKNRFMCFATRFCNHMVHHVSDHQVMDNMEQNHWIKTVFCDNVVINRWYSEPQKLRTFITPANTTPGCKLRPCSFRAMRRSLLGLTRSVAEPSPSNPFCPTCPGWRLERLPTH